MGVLTGKKYVKIFMGNYLRGYGANWGSVYLLTVFVFISAVAFPIDAYEEDYCKYATNIWDFKKGPITWDLQGGNLETVSDGIRITTKTPKEIRLVSPRYSCTPFVLNHICFKTKSNTPLKVQIAFRTEKLYQWSEDRVASDILVPDDGKFHEFDIDMSGHCAWNDNNGFVIQTALVITAQDEKPIDLVIDWIGYLDMPLNEWTPELFAQGLPEDEIWIPPQPDFKNRLVSYIDHETGNKVTVIASLSRGANSTTYHFFRPFNRNGQWMIFEYAGKDGDEKFNGIYNLNLANGEYERLTSENTGFSIITSDGEKLVYFERRRSYRDVYVGSIYELDLRTKFRRHIYDFPENIGLLDFSITKDDRYLILHTYIKNQPSKQELDEIEAMPTPRDKAMARVAFMKKNKTRYWVSKLDMQSRQCSRAFAIIDHYGQHNQISPTDSSVLLQKVLNTYIGMPLWLIDINTGKMRPLLNYEQWYPLRRSFVMFGHAAWSLDGKYVWCEARQWIDDWTKEQEQVFRQEKFMWLAEKQWYLCRIDVATGNFKLWPVDYDALSVHYTPTKYSNILTCDGNNVSRYISIIQVMPDKIEQTKLCRVPHDYLLFEPYCHLTPDGKGVVFNTIYQNQKVVCIVEVPEKLQVLMMKDESILEN